MSEAIRIAVCVPTAGTVSAFFAHSLAALMAYGNSLRQRPETEAIELTLLLQETSVIHANREKLVEQALEWGATHILFLDDDMVFRADVLSIMLGRRHAMVACNYPKRGWPITFTAIKPSGNAAIITHKESTGLEEAAYTGFGVSLIAAEVFRKTPKPWFLPLYLGESNTYTTEDNPFCIRIREQGFKVYVDHDASKLVGHRGMHTYEWNQYQPQATAKDREANQLSANVVALKGSAA